MRLDQPRFLGSTGEMPGWELIAEANASVDATVDLTGFENYDRVYVDLYRIECDVDDRGLAFRVSFDGTTFPAGAADYNWQGTALTTSISQNTDISDGEELIVINNAANDMGTAGGEFLYGNIIFPRVKPLAAADLTSAFPGQYISWTSGWGAGGAMGLTWSCGSAQMGTTGIPTNPTLHGIRFDVGDGESGSLSGRFRAYGIR